MKDYVFEWSECDAIHRHEARLPRKDLRDSVFGDAIGYVARHVPRPLQVMAEAIEMIESTSDDLGNVFGAEVQEAEMALVASARKLLQVLKTYDE